MPWHIEKQDGRHCVIKNDDGHNQGCHDTRESAEKQMAALYANEEMMQSKMYLLDDFLTVRKGEPYRLFPLGRIVKGGTVREITKELAGKFRLPHFRPAIKLGSSTDRTSITGIKGNADVSIYETAEAGVKTGTKVTYLPFELTFKKFAAIAPVTDELLEDSAVAIWADLTSRFARAYAKKEDELVFTVAATGIINLGGVAPIAIIGDSIEDITFDEVNRAIYSVPTPSMQNGRFYFHRTILGVLQRIKDTQERYILTPGPDGPVSGTLWGVPYELTEVLTSLDNDAAGTPFIVFGDLKNTILGDRTRMTAKIFDTGSVVDADEEDLNLLTQDAQAMRVVKRFNALTVFEEAYAVISTGGAS